MVDVTSGSGDCVTVVRAGAAATVMLNRPQALNALDVAHSRALLASLTELSADAGVRAVCLTGAGRAFCSGADLAEMRELRAESRDGRPDLQAALTARFNPITLVLREMPKPVVAAVNGPCVGIGVAFALACDHVVAAESAYFLLAFANIGLAPDGGASALLPARVGVMRAADLAISGRRLSSAGALDWGLVDAVVPDRDLATRASAIAKQWADGPTRSYAAIKRQLNASVYRNLRAQLELEAELQQELVGTDDFLEGIGAFVEKRATTFRGA